MRAIRLKATLLCLFLSPLFSFSGKVRGMRETDTCVAYESHPNTGLRYKVPLCLFQMISVGRTTLALLEIWPASTLGMLLKVFAIGLLGEWVKIRICRKLMACLFGLFFQLPNAPEMRFFL